MCKKSNFKPLSCGFHSHCEYSLDGGSTAERKLKYCAQIERVADCLTDHGILSGLADHWMTAEKLKKKGKLPEDFIIIHGVEAYILDEHRPPQILKNGKQIPSYYHLTIHFKNMDAYFYFCKLSKQAEERAVVKYGERKPIIRLCELEDISGNITIGSACLIGPVQKNVLVGNYELAEKMYFHLRGLAGPENFYVEVFPHIIDRNWRRPEYKDKKKVREGEFELIKSVRDWEGPENQMPEPDPCTGAIDIQKRPNEFVLSMAQKHGDRVVISLDDHFGAPEDKAVQEARLGNGTENWRFYNSLHALTVDEAVNQLKQQLDVSDKQIEEWVDNGYEFIEHFKDYKFPTQKDQALLPYTEMVYDDKYKGVENIDIFWRLVEKHNKLPADPDKRQQYIDRVKYELSIICNNDAGIDFLPYFFLLEDVCEYARNNDIVMTSRGSAGGSMCLYLLNIVITDPIKHKLSFERFLNPGRIKGGSWPDVDLDWENRHLIIKYIKDKYGDKYALIANDGKMRLKSSILDAVRAEHGSVSDDIALMTKSIPIPIGTGDDAKWLYGTDAEPGFWYSEEPVAVQLRQFAEDNPKIWDMVNRCIGVTRQRGIHAGGIVITPGPVNQFMPVIKQSGTDEQVTAYNMHGVEYTGGVKYDILGIKTLDALGVAVRSIKEKEGVDLGWGEFPEDSEVFENIIKPMKLEGVFQLNTNVARPYVKKVQPKNIKEISALTALCRPGALDADAPDPDFNGTAAEYFVECAQGKRKPYIIHEDIRDIFEETHGIGVYQEQLIQAGSRLCGYSEGEADIIIRKGIGKKIPEKIKQFSDDLRARLPQRGWSEEQIDQLINMAMASARYSFNRSHSTSYGIVAWNCAYVKHYYPAHYWKGMLTVFGDKEEKLDGMLAECKDRIRGLDVIRSHPTDWLIEDDYYLRMPLNIIKGCGDAGVESLKTFLNSSFEELAEVKEKEKAAKAAKKQEKENGN